MARPKVKLNHAAVGTLLKSAGFQSMVADATAAVAAQAAGMGVDVEGIPGDIAIPVETSMTTTDRAHGTVTLAHPSGQAVQAKHGLLTKAAAAAGLEVNAK